MRLRSFHTKKIVRLLLVALLLAASCTFLFPALASARVLGGGNLTGFYTGQIDAPTLFSLLMITLVELGAVFWVGAQLWLNFVLQTSSEKHKAEQDINKQVQDRFEQRFSLPVLLVILLANVGVLIGQALNLTGGDWGRSLSPASLAGLATSARFGIFWLIGEGVLILAILIALYQRLAPRHPRPVEALLPLANLLLGLVLFISMTMTTYTVSGNNNVVTISIVLAWLRLLAMALWIGGLFYLAAIYLPTLKKHSLAEEGRSLATVLPYFTPLAITGVILTFATVIFGETLQQIPVSQIITSAYGRAYIVEVVLLIGLLVCSVLQLFLFNPRVTKEYRKYAYATKRFVILEAPTAVEVEAPQSASPGQKSSTVERVVTTDQSAKSDRQVAQQVRLRESRLTKKTLSLAAILRWEPVLGIAVLLAVGLMSAFAGTISALPTTTQPHSGGKTLPFTSTVHTSDNKFTAQLEINPNRFGANVFTVTVTDSSTGAIDTNVSVYISTTMLDMDMGTDLISLVPDSKGHFNGSGDLAMSGNWQISIQIHTPDHALHEVTVNIVTPF